MTLNGITATDALDLCGSWVSCSWFVRCREVRCSAHAYPTNPSYRSRWVSDSFDLQAEVRLAVVRSGMYRRCRATWRRRRDASGLATRGCGGCSIIGWWKGTAKARQAMNSGSMWLSCNADNGREWNLCAGCIKTKFHYFDLLRVCCGLCICYNSGRLLKRVPKCISCLSTGRLHSKFTTSP